MHRSVVIVLVCIGLHLFSSCDSDEETAVVVSEIEWTRSINNPVFRDLIPEESYEIASDPHVFFDGSNTLQMIYSGDENKRSSIKLATGTSWDNWSKSSSLLFETGPSNLDVYKETSFYRKTNTGVHQIYYIGYADEETYEAQIFLAEAASLNGPYTQMAQPVVAQGELAGKNVYCMTSPSVIEHEGLLYMTFIGWNAAPDDVTEVWIMGATSSDDGRTWGDFQLVDARIGMEGQITKTPNDTFVAVRTADYQDKEAIYYATATHPFGPWTEEEAPILSQTDAILEKDEIIAPQITYDPQTNEQLLFYTGADHLKGWWIMLASKK
ncbi:hypothetical protein N9954_04885 [Maribacter sp.]|nr:hypothetical protein [Maribacter sp.]